MGGREGGRVGSGRVDWCERRAPNPHMPVGDRQVPHAWAWANQGSLVYHLISRYMGPHVGAPQRVNVVAVRVQILMLA